MALVPFHVSGAAASQDLEERLMQVGPYSLLLRQRPGASGNTAHLKAGGTKQQGRDGHQAAAAAASQDQPQHPDLSQVGLVLWQSGFVLADFLLLRLAGAGGAVGSNSGGVAGGSSGSWAGVRVLELGCGGGTVGLFLALAGAQVVLTDQKHILALTRENLALNFPATAASSYSSSHQQATSTGRFFSPPAGQANAEQAAVGASSGSGAKEPNGSLQASIVQQPMSAAAAFAAAFGSPASNQSTGAVSAHQQNQQQQQQSEDSTMCLVSQVYGPGPLVVDYSWGEPLQLLQNHLAAAAGARLSNSSAAAAAGAASSTQQATSSTAQSAAAGAAPQQQVGASPAAASPPAAAVLSSGRPTRAGAGPLGGACPDRNVQASSLQQLAAQPFDVIVGADLLYDFRCHAALLNSLQQFAAASPHLQVFLCWRYRVLGEQAFLEAATAAGWVIEGVPASMLHPEFQTGYYKLVRMVRLP